MRPWLASFWLEGFQRRRTLRDGRKRLAQRNDSHTSRDHLALKGQDAAFVGPAFQGKGPGSIPLVVRTFYQKQVKKSSVSFRLVLLSRMKGKPMRKLTKEQKRDNRLRNRSGGLYRP